jgi:hypothetical protein
MSRARKYVYKLNKLTTESIGTIFVYISNKLYNIIINFWFINEYLRYLISCLSSTELQSGMSPN